MNSDGVSEQATLHAHRGAWPRLRVKSRSRLGEARAWRVAGCCLILCAIGTGSAAAKSKTDAAAPARKPAAAKPENAGNANSNAAKPESGASAPAARFDIDEFRSPGRRQPAADRDRRSRLSLPRPEQDRRRCREGAGGAGEGLSRQGLSDRRRLRSAAECAARIDHAQGDREPKVGRLRVKNSRYFDLANIKSNAPSLKEGSVPNFRRSPRTSSR